MSDRHDRHTSDKHTRYVSRNKYDRARHAIEAWEDQNKTLTKETEELHEVIEQLTREKNHLERENRKLKEEVVQWKESVQNSTETDIIHDLQQENSNQRSEIRKLRKQLSHVDEKYREQIARLERSNLLSEGRVQQLEEARKDLQERYNDLKQDYREQQRWMHAQSGQSISSSHQTSSHKKRVENEM